MEDDSTTACLEVGGAHGRNIVPHISTNKLKQNGLVVINVVLACMVVSVVIILSTTRCHRTDARTVCMKCSELDSMIDRWAWIDVEEDKAKGQCCFVEEFGLIKTLKYYLQTRVSGNHGELERLEDKMDKVNVLVWELYRNNSGNLSNTTLSSNVGQDIATMMDHIKTVFHRKRPVLNLISLNMVFLQEPKILWRNDVKQGNISLSNDGHSISIMNSGLYFISTQIKFLSKVSGNETKRTTLQFYIVKMKHRQLRLVDDYRKRVVFHEKMTEHDALLNTIARLDGGDELTVRFPSSQKAYLATGAGMHRISILELY